MLDPETQGQMPGNLSVYLLLFSRAVVFKPSVQDFVRLNLFYRLLIYTFLHLRASALNVLI